MSGAGPSSVPSVPFPRRSHRTSPGYFVFGLPSWYLASFRIRVWDVPNKHFSGLGRGFPKAKNRKRVLACCACYLLHTPTERRYLLRAILILNVKKDCSRHALQSCTSLMREVSPPPFLLPLFPLPLRLQSVCPYRSYRPTARQAAAARWIFRH